MEGKRKKVKEVNKNHEERKEMGRTKKTRVRQELRKKKETKQE